MLLFPMATAPKFKLEVELVSTAEAAIPVPLTVTMSGVVETLLMIATPPESAPAVLGANTTFRVARFPGAIVIGSETPLTVTPVAVALAWVMVTLDVLVFEMVTDCEAVEPSGTEPNVIAEGATEIPAAPEGLCWLDKVFGAPVTPTQPETQKMAQKRRIRAAREIPFRCAEPVK